MAAFTLAPLFADFKMRDNRGRIVSVEPAQYLGYKNNRLLVVAKIGGDLKSTRELRFTSRSIGDTYLFLCDCGNYRTGDMQPVKKGLIKSCGCYKKEHNGAHGITHGATRIGNKWPEYAIWGSMLMRCTNPNDKGYKYYGGRGIKVHPDFLKFEGFIRYLGRSNGLSLERLDVNGDYAPGNVAWIPHEDQAGNKRNTVWVRHNSENINLEKAIRISGKSRDAYFTLRRHGKNVQEAFDLTPLKIENTTESIQSPPKSIQKTDLGQLEKLPPQNLPQTQGVKWWMRI